MKNVKAGYYAQLIQIAKNGYQNGYETDFQRLYELYKGELPVDIKESLEQRRKSSITVNKAYALVQRLKSSAEQSYFTNPSFASFIPLTPYEENASEEMQKAFDYYWTKRMRAYISLSQTFTDGFTYGTPVIKIYWSNGAPVLEHVNISDIYFDPSARSFKDNRFIINNVFMTVDDVAALKKSGVYNKRFRLDEIKPNNNTGTTEYNSFVDETQDENSFGRVMLQDVYEYLEGDWYITTTYNELTLLRERVLLNDGLPLQAGLTVPALRSPTEGEVATYSDSLLGPIYDLQLELNTRVNQEIDAISENLNPSLYAERNSGINEIDMRKGPSRVVYVSNLEQIQQIPPPPLAPLQMNEERIRTDIEEITGIQMLGSADTSAIVNRQTAEGMNILSSEKDLRTDNYIRTLNETFIEPMIEKVSNLIWKYSDLPQFFKGIDRSKDFAFSVNVAAGLGATSKQMQLNGLNEAFQKFMALGDSQRAEQTVVDSLPLMGIRNTAEYYEPKTKSQKRQEREQQKAQAQESGQKQQQLEERKVEAEISKLENESSSYLVEAEKTKVELEIAREDTTVEQELKVKSDQTENRRLDIEEQQFLVDAKNEEEKLRLEWAKLEQASNTGGANE